MMFLKGGSMDIYLENGKRNPQDPVFVDLGRGYLLRIGTKAEVDKADYAQIREMVRKAVADDQFQAIIVSPDKKALH